ncbi:Uncharacterized conserved protein, DUF1697 family [Maribacter orientalis]|uniref:Uncharacterized conserved protein, DUF1697 family n=1 Tax=Maribacter orientalis TaxID=228957 RepID=A0A1H7K739_9FLAO|nr:DUF1697 domain-containing protein [Maribacter orientalis]SEK82562.1 Uncharacterized conserved protein, DUF1697 family [Maribacter orientalis]
MKLITYVAFLRGINVSGKRKVPMAELRAMCERLNLQNVKTYIQSGNIVFKSSMVQTNEIAILLHNEIQKHFNFNVPVIVKTVNELSQIIEKNPFVSQEDITANRIYFVLLNSLPAIELLENLSEETFENEEYVVIDNCLYLKCALGYGKAKLNNNLIERKLKVMATTRNYRTMNKLQELCN